MATVKIVLRGSKEKGFARFRLSCGRGKKYYVKSKIEIPIAFWDVKKERIKPRAAISDAERERITRELSEMKERVLSAYRAHEGEMLTSELLSAYVYNRDDAAEDDSFFGRIDKYISRKERLGEHVKADKTLKGALRRFEKYSRLSFPGFELSFAAFTPDFLARFELFLRDEHALSLRFPDILKPCKPRGNNYMALLMRRFRAFSRWSAKENFTPNPFERYSVKSEVYGTPYYITVEERNRIADFDLSAFPKLSVQRDIFIFQCLVGCRVSDLRKLTRANVSGGFLEYVPGKTKKERAETVRVPLNDRAKLLLAKYAESFSEGSFLQESFSEGSFSEGSFSAPLFPFVSPQKYNDAIKKIFRLCGIDRLVTVLDPVTGEERKRPICEVASSHMARRTFIGNIYKKVKDPNLVGSMTGHKEGSRAFSRYREIDDEIKKELVSLIE